MRRHEFPAKVKLAAFERAGGKCEKCHARIVSAEYDHVIPAMLGGDATLDNCECLCAKCHRLKTSRQDVPRIAKAKRQERMHKGIDRPKRKIPSRPFQVRGFVPNTKYVERDFDT
jgi:5-methylcytosine-specific restriction endonuclease McrA